MKDWVKVRILKLPRERQERKNRIISENLTENGEHLLSVIGGLVKREYYVRGSYPDLGEIQPKGLSGEVETRIVEESISPVITINIRKEIPEPEPSSD